MSNYHFYFRNLFLLFTLTILFAGCGSDIALHEQQSTDATTDNPALSEAGAEQIFQEDSHGTYYSMATPLWKMTSDMILPNYPVIGAWTTRALAIGDEGRKIATAAGPYSSFTTILSSRAPKSDAASFVPETFEMLGVNTADYFRVAMSKNSDLTAFMYQVPDPATSGMKMVRIAVRWVSRAIRYSITLPTRINDQEVQEVLVTGDNRIVAVVKNIYTSKADVTVYDGATGALLNSYSIAQMAFFLNAKLSDDGQYLLLIAQNRLIGISLATGAMVFGPFGVFDDLHGGDISSSGIYAAGCVNEIVKIQKIGAGGVYSDYHTVSLGTGHYCNHLDFSDDASTLVVAFNSFVAGQNRVDVLAVDLPTRTTLMSYPINGTGTLQNYSADIKSSATGDRFIVGVWGDGTVAQGGGQAKEVYIFDKNISFPVAIHDMPGSTYQVAISADGRYATASGKGTDALNLHTNTLGGGSWLASFLAKPTTDLMARGNQWNSLPGQDNQVELAVKAPAGSTVHLFKSASRSSTNIGNVCLGSDKVNVASLTVPAGEQEVKFMRPMSLATNQNEFYQAAVLLADMSRRWTNCERVTSISR